MSDNKTIAKNTIFLYTRMLINMLVALYTSRVVLNVLGVTDFGIYNLVGGVIGMFAFLNNSMSAATQRFINFEKASNALHRIKLIFNLSLRNHVMISFLVLVLGETIGVWFINFKLNIPPERLYAANIVFQFSIFTAFFDVIRIPYSAIIIAFEKMSFFAMLGVLETITKIIIIVMLLNINNVDHLILYSGLYFLSSMFSNILFFVYCQKHFKKYVGIDKAYDSSKNKELLSFSSWIIFGQVASIGANQGLSMILNIFYGVVVNAAMGIAYQVNNAVYGFVSNFQVAFQPQIVQTYANNESERNRKLILNTSKYSLYLIIILSLPLLFFTSEILRIWLGNEVPKYASEFVKIVLSCSIIDAIAGPFWMASTAIGNIKTYNITLTLINFITLPLAVLLLYLGYNPIYAFSVKFFISIGMQLFRYIFIHNRLQFNRKELMGYFQHIALIIVVTISILIIGNEVEISSLWHLFLGIILLEFTLLTLIALFGVSKSERSQVLNYLGSKIKKN